MKKKASHEDTKPQRHEESHSEEGLQMAESDFSDYLANLEQYEERVARGEIRW